MIVISNVEYYFAYQSYHMCHMCSFQVHIHLKTCHCGMRWTLFPYRAAIVHIPNVYDSIHNVVSTTIPIAIAKFLYIETIPFLLLLVLWLKLGYVLPPTPESTKIVWLTLYIIDYLSLIVFTIDRSPISPTYTEDVKLDYLLSVLYSTYGLLIRCIGL